MLMFQGNSLHYTPSGFIGRKQTQTYAIRDVDKYRFNDGQLELFQGENNKPVIFASTQQKNFFPGFYCWLRLVNTPVQTVQQE
jgi:hypothetical protein